MSDSGLVKALCPMVGGGPCSIDCEINIFVCESQSYLLALLTHCDYIGIMIIGSTYL